MNKHTNFILSAGVARATIGDVQAPAAPTQQATSGHLVGDVTQVIFNANDTQVSTAGVHRHTMNSASAPSVGVKYSTPLGTPLAAADAKPTDLVTFSNGMITSLRAARAAGLL
jgi:hypothetical protein